MQFLMCSPGYISGFNSGPSHLLLLILRVNVWKCSYWRGAAENHLSSCGIGRSQSFVLRSCSEDNRTSVRSSTTAYYPLSRGDYVNSLISNVQPWPHFVRMVTGRLARAEEPLQLGHAQVRGGAFGVLSVRRPGAAPGPREPGHERHLN